MKYTDSVRVTSPAADAALGNSAAKAIWGSTSSNVKHHPFHGEEISLCCVQPYPIFCCVTSLTGKAMCYRGRKVHTGRVVCFFTLEYFQLRESSPCRHFEIALYRFLDKEQRLTFSIKYCVFYFLLKNISHLKTNKQKQPKNWLVIKLLASNATSPLQYI